jgi:hypothetical protein
VCVYPINFVSESAIVMMKIIPKTAVGNPTIKEFMS